MKNVWIKVLISIGLMMNVIWLAQATGFDPDTWFFPNNDTILTNDVEDVIEPEVGQGDWFNTGIDTIVGDCAAGEGLQGIYCEPIEDNATAWERLTDLIKAVLNYFLWIIGLVAMVYLLYHAFLTLTAGDDEERASEWFKGMKYAFIAIIGIWLSWFFVSAIFFILSTVTDAL